MKCPVCEKTSHYEKPEDIPTDFKLITMIKILKLKTYFNFSPNMIINNLNGIPKIIE